jgi:uncharacterized Zn-finger protein
MFTCEVCAKVYTAKRSLSAHVKSTHDGVKFTCDICLKSFTRKFKLNRHKKNSHRESVIRYAPPVVIGQPPSITPEIAPAITPAIAPTSGPWDGAICDDELLEIMDDFEKQGKKIHYSMH